MCQEVWVRAYQDDPEESPNIQPVDVETAIPATLRSATNALEWLWDGLGPAQRVVASALAGAGSEAVTQEELEQRLQESGARILVGELQDAPRVLQEWDLIEPANGGYRFRVELLRRWIATRKPLALVQKEIDRIHSVAYNLFKAGDGLYRDGQLKQAVPPLRQAIGLNPNHLRANKLLAEILLAQGEATEALQLLESLYKYDSAAARPRLVQALLLQTQDTDEEDKQLALYKRVLQLEHNHPEAITGCQRIWISRGNIALIANDLKGALEAYRRVSLENTGEIKTEWLHPLKTKLQGMASLGPAEQYQSVLELVRQLHDDYPEERDSLPDLYQLERKAHLDDLYQQALNMLEDGNRQAAQKLLAQVVALEPGYREATRYLHLAATKVDVADLKIQLKEQQKIQQQQAEDIKVKIKQLETELNFSPWNLLNHLRFLWLSFVYPQRLKDYQERFDPADIGGLDKWLISTLIWLPLFSPTLALGIGTLPEGHWSPATYLWLSGVLALAWLFTGLKSSRTDIVTIIMAPFVATIVAAVVGFSVAVGIAANVVFGVAVIVAVSIATAVLEGVLVDTAIRVVTIVFIRCSVASGMATGMVVRGGAFYVEGDRVLVVIAVVAGIITLGLAYVVAEVVAGNMRANLKSGRSSWLARGSFGTLLLAHVFIVWFSFLGGRLLFS